MENKVVHSPMLELRANGFENSRLNCWLNSALQALLSCTIFGKYVTDNAACFTNNPIAVTYLQILRSQHQCQSLWILNKLTDVTTTERPQKCALEGMMKLVDRISESHKPLGDLFTCMRKFENVCSKCSHKTIACESTNFIQHVASNKNFVEDLCKHDVVLEDFTCPNCKVKSNATRTEKVVGLGKIVCVVMDKLHTADNFPVCFTVAGSAGHQSYLLVAIVDHVGTQDEGHYTARVLRNDGWVVCDDTQVIIATPEPTGSEFILLYELSA